MNSDPDQAAFGRAVTDTRGAREERGGWVLTGMLLAALAVAWAYATFAAIDAVASEPCPGGDCREMEVHGRVWTATGCAILGLIGTGVAAFLAWAALRHGAGGPRSRWFWPGLIALALIIPPQMLFYSAVGGVLSG